MPREPLCSDLEDDELPELSLEEEQQGEERPLPRALVEIMGFGSRVLRCFPEVVGRGLLHRAGRLIGEALIIGHGDAFLTAAGEAWMKRLGRGLPPGEELLLRFAAGITSPSPVPCFDRDGRRIHLVPVRTSFLDDLETVGQVATLAAVFLLPGYLAQGPTLFEASGLHSGLQVDGPFWTPGEPLLGSPRGRAIGEALLETLPPKGSVGTLQRRWARTLTLPAHSPANSDLLDMDLLDLGLLGREALTSIGRSLAAFLDSPEAPGVVRCRCAVVELAQFCPPMPWMLRRVPRLGDLPGPAPSGIPAFH